MAIRVTTSVSSIQNISSPNGHHLAKCERHQLYRGKVSVELVLNAYLCRYRTPTHEPEVPSDIFMHLVASNQCESFFRARFDALD